jgi:hypothetical protein
MRQLFIGTMLKKKKNMEQLKQKGASTSHLLTKSGYLGKV